MNVHVPGQDDLTAFFVVVVLMVVLLVGMLALFRRRGWL
jgi:magnesium transporter